MADGQKVTFSGEGDQEPGLEPGDIIIVLDEKEHPSFKRSGTGNHLIKNPNVSKHLNFSAKKSEHFSPFKEKNVPRKHKFFSFDDFTWNKEKSMDFFEENFLS